MKKLTENKEKIKESILDKAQDRRAFLLSLSKSVLPGLALLGLGVAALSGCGKKNPVSCYGCEGGCEGSCYTACIATCEGGCDLGCEGSCEGGCTGSCKGGCKIGCASACSAVCSNIYTWN